MNYEIVPQNIDIREGACEKITVYEIKDDGEKKIVSYDNLRFQAHGDGAYIDEFGQMTAINLGNYTFDVIIQENDDSKIVSGTYTIREIEEKKSINQKYIELEKTEKTVPKLERTSLKRITIEESQEALERKKKGFMAHSRAIIRTIDANSDLVWLGIVILLSGILGAGLVLLLSGFTLEKISAFVLFFLSAIFSFFKKIYSSPGEVSSEIEEKMLGTNDQERLESLEKKKKEIDSRINRLTTKIRNIEPKKQKNFYKLTIDETAH